METSRRRTAEEVGLSPQGLGNFLRGAKPHPSTLRRMLSWHAGRVRLTGPTSVSTAEALGALVEALPPTDRGQALSELRNFVGELYQRRGYPVPKDLAATDEA